MNSIEKEVIRRAQQRRFNPMLDMMNKVQLLRKFYSSMRQDTLKLEVRDYGLHVPDIAVKNGLRVEYGELQGNIIKYKISGVNAVVINLFILQHVNKISNVCLYFDEIANNVFALNLDNSNADNDKYTQELKETQYLIHSTLEQYGIEPMVYASGRGYHTLVRISERIDNSLLRDFMEKVWILTRIKQEGLGMGNKFDISMYPSREHTKDNSLRLFGSEQMRTKMFSYVIDKDKGTLNEADSWRYFEGYMKKKTLTKVQFELAYKKLMNFGRLEGKAV